MVIFFCRRTVDISWILDKLLYYIRISFSIKFDQLAIQININFLYVTHISQCMADFLLTLLIMYAFDVECYFCHCSPFNCKKCNLIYSRDLTFYNLRLCSDFYAIFKSYGYDEIPLTFPLESVFNSQPSLCSPCV